MNIKKVEKQLWKIQQLLSNIKEEEIVSKIEQDLLLSYVRGLYEKILEDQDVEQKEVKKNKKDNHKPKSEKVAEPVYRTPVQNSPVVEAVRKEVSNDRSNESTNYSSESKSDTSPQNPKLENHVNQSNVNSETVVAQAPKVPQELLDLFKLEKGNSELSDKLSNAPITDLTRSMGINERIFTVQELFGGDASLFNQTMDYLNGLKSLEQARDYLVKDVALKNNWAEEENIKKATYFVKLISRRY